MKTKTMTMLGAIALIAAASSASAAEPNVLQFEEPVKVQARRVQPFEVVTGTFLSLVLSSADPAMVLAVVSSDIYDHYNNVAIPKGGQLVGREIRQVNDRHDIAFTGLQIPGLPGTLRLEPALRATMPDGSAGVTTMEHGARIGAIVGEPFIVPH
ncbi:conjugal transfer protein [Ralstonia nicotianae]